MLRGVNILRAEDGKSVLLVLATSGDAEIRIVLREAEVASLIKGLHQSYKFLVSQKDNDAPPGAKVAAIINPKFMFNKEIMENMSALTFDHPDLGPLGFILPNAVLRETLSVLNVEDAREGGDRRKERRKAKTMH